MASANSAATSHQSEPSTGRGAATARTMVSMISFVIQRARTGTNEARKRKASPKPTTTGPDSQTILRTRGTLGRAEKRSLHPFQKFSRSAISERWKSLPLNLRDKIPRFLKKILWEVLRNLLRSCRGRAFRIINSRLVITPEAGAVHSPTCFWTHHECFPDEAGSSVLRHEHSDSGINSNHAAVIPIGERIERVHKAVLAPRGPIAILHRLQNEHYGLGQEGQRTRGGSGHHGPINGANRRRSTPN